MQTEASPSSAGPVLEGLQVYQDQQDIEIGRLQRISTLLSVGLAIILIGFIALFFRTLGTNFAQDQITSSLQRNLPEMLPDLANGTVQIVTRTYPTYAELLQKETIEGLPELTTVAETQMSLLVEEVERGTQARLHKAILDAFVAEGKPLRTVFPKVTHEEVTQVLDGFAKDVEEDLVVVVNEVMLSHIGEIISLKKTLDAFPTQGLPNDEVALSKRLVHDLLGLLDLEVQEAK